MASPRHHHASPICISHNKEQPQQLLLCVEPPPPLHLAYTHIPCLTLANTMPRPSTYPMMSSSLYGCCIVLSLHCRHASSPAALYDQQLHQ
ncbi:hypothetical protein CVT25_002902 [Psilocybe cyanescens]|uniref:Uncharacterized protein n=1 Tax=Psilocybe cyanescens TaxID=93625 RepID=A0A409X4U7_PSICY|nr:hypothetical protein CVT25_002902 [Psilocybe cyanescens]